MRVLLVVSMYLLLVGCLSGGQSTRPAEPLPIAIQSDWQIDEAIVQQVTDAVAESHPALDDRSMYTQRLRMVSRRLRSVDNLQFIAIGTLEVNAFSLPDGRIFVSRNMLDLLDDNEILAVLALEIGHMQLGTSKSRVQSAAASVVGDGEGVLTPEQKSAVIDSYARTQYDAAQVAEAQELANQILHRAGRPVSAQDAALVKLAALEGAHPWQRAHPSLFPNTIAPAPEAVEPAAEEESVDRLAEALGSAAPDTQEPPQAVRKEIKTATLSSRRVKTITPLPAEPPEELAQPKEPEMAAEEVIEEIPPPDSQTIDRQTKEAALGSGWYVQIAAEQSAAVAGSKQQSLQQMGHIVTQQAVVVNGQQYFRVLIGPFSSRARAERTRQGVLQTPEARDTPFLKHIE